MFFRMNLENCTGNDAITASWAGICEEFSVPKTLYRHQVDTMSLLLSGEHVFCGSPTGRAEQNYLLTLTLYSYTELAPKQTFFLCKTWVEYV